MDFIFEVLDDYQQNSAFYADAEIQLTAACNKMLKDNGISSRTIYQSRIKKYESLKKKLEDRVKNYNTKDQIAADTKDLVASRVIVTRSIDLDIVRKLIEDNFNVVDSCQHPKASSLPNLVSNKNRFRGYDGHHFYITLPESTDTLNPLESKNVRLHSFTMEIQVMSVWMFAFSVLDHDLTYKKLNGEPSEDILQSLELLKGVANIGEVALERFDKIMAHPGPQKEPLLSRENEAIFGSKDQRGVTVAAVQEFLRLFRSIQDVLPLVEGEGTIDRKQPASSEFSLEPWLDPSDMDAIIIPLEENIAEFPNACKWILEKPIYQKWKTQENGRCLCFHGESGTGKSSVMCRIKADLQSHDQNNYLLYYFCKVSDSTPPTIDRIIRTLLYQLSLQCESVERDLWAFRKKHPRLNSIDIKPILRRQLQLTLDTLPPTAVVRVLLGGLDEMGSTAKEKETLLRILVPVNPNPSKAKLFCIFTTRSICLHQLNEVQHIPITAEDTKSDMAELVRDGLRKFCTSTQKDRLEKRITEMAQGTFLWTTLVLDDLSHAHAVEDIDSLLEDVPQDLIEYYERHLERLEARIRGDNPNKMREKEIAVGQAILGWALLSKGPFSLAEFQEALFYMGYGTFENLESTIPSICGPFLKISKDKKVDPTHASVVRFFLDTASQPAYTNSEANTTQHLRFNVADMHLKIFGACFNALARARSTSSPFITYATRNLTAHLHSAVELSDNSQKQIIADALLRTRDSLDCDTVIEFIEAAEKKEFDISQLAVDSGFSQKATVKFGPQNCRQNSGEAFVPLRRLGQLYMQQDRYSDAIILFKTRLLKLQHLGMINEAIQGMVDAAEAHELARDFKAGEKLRLKALKLKQQQPESDETFKFIAEQQKCLGLNYEEQNNAEQAKWFFHVCEENIGILKSIDPDLAVDLREEVALFRERSGLSTKTDTLRIFTDIWEEKVKEQGHDSVAAMLRLWYVAYFTMDEPENWLRSDKIWEEIIRWKRLHEGLYTGTMVAFVKTWAWVCKKHERWEKARSLAEDVLEIAKRSYKPDSLSMATCFFLLGDIAISQGRKVDGIAYYEDGLKIHEDVVGKQHPWTINHRDTLEKCKSEAADGRPFVLQRREYVHIHPHVSRSTRNWKEWRFVKNSMEHQLYT